MNKSKSYTGIDLFRFFAAFLIIAIHTSPLLSYNETTDFILTRITARIAVPFFLMTSGFFLISRYTYNFDKLKSFVKKTALIYGISIAIYIPINIYNGYFTMENLFPNIIKDVFFDGTMYHLWYLPASIIGGVSAWFIVKKAGFNKALFITSALYIVGLMGDSYYGLAEKFPLLKSLYSNIFEVSDYTRNGIFFAPVFFVLGGMIADKSVRISLKNSVLGFGVSFLLMFWEGMLLHNLGLQRHDSMYILLLPCMYYLFNALTYWRGPRVKLLRTSALIIYIVHPMMIVVTRMSAKILGMQTFFVENSLVHFLAVSITSTAVSILITWIIYRLKGKRTKSLITDRAWIQVDLKNLKHNVKTLKEAMPKGCELMAVVKAEAYGHGAFEVSTYVNRMGVKAFAVAAIQEGIALRRYGIQGEILILGYTNPAQAKELHKFNLTQTLIDYNYAYLLDKQGYKINGHIKIDTGMHRLGVPADEAGSILKIFGSANLNISGIYTHLCVSDSLAPGDVSFTKKQINSFYKLLNVLAENGVKIPKIHIQSSYGLLNYPELKCDYVRTGVSLYGVLSSPHDKTKLELDLRPVLSLKSQIVLLRKIKKGESVGYGRAFIADRESMIGILPIGYADGLPRSLSGRKSEVLINGKPAPIIGRICMDQLAVDVTDIPNAAVGDIAVLIGKDGKCELSAEGVADCSGSITNELLSRMGRRLKIETGDTFRV